MKKNIFCTIICLILNISFCVAYSAGDKAPSISEFHKQVIIGQSDFDNYYGPISPDFEKNGKYNDVNFLDDQYFDSFFNNYFSNKLFEVSDIWQTKITESSSCTNSELSENISYIRYLFRLISMSYLFEAIKEYHVTLHQLGYSKKLCPVTWNDMFSSCNPKTDEMKKFVRRVKYAKFTRLNNSRFVKKNKKDLAKWLKKLKKDLSKRHSTYIPAVRVLRWFEKQKVELDNFSKRDVAAAMLGGCIVDKELLLNICSEKDDLFGISYVPKLKKLILTSHAMNLINKNGNGKNCINRFVKIFEKTEVRYPYLKDLFDAVSRNLSNFRVSKNRGDLFIPGSLKEFDDKGLKDFLYVAKKKPKSKPKTKKVVVRPKPKPTPKPIVKVVASPKPKPKPKPIIKKVVPKVSYFEKMVRKHRSKKLKTLALSMKKFRDDFTFGKRIVRSLGKIAKDYQTRSALSDMKEFDKLGSKKEPIRLYFLKFLLDKGYHQGLFNIVSIIGSKFYILNDIDKRKKPVYIELKSDESTGYQWLITILNSPKKKVKKAPAAKHKQKKKMKK